MNQKFDLCFHSELRQVKGAVQKVLSFLDEGAPSIAPDDKMELKLVFSELLCNAVIHGNKGDTGKRVFLTAEIDDGAIYSSIMDEGQGFNTEPVLDGSLFADIEDENGRGIQLARALTDSFKFSPKGNQIFFYKKVKTV